MPDIAMCTSPICPKNTQCYRFMASATPEYQTYSDFEVMGCHEDFKWFWGIDGRKIREIEKVEAIKSVELVEE